MLMSILCGVVHKGSCGFLLGFITLITRLIILIAR